MLPLGFASDFEEPHEVELPLNGPEHPPAKFKLKPLTVDDYLQLIRLHGICTRCWGTGRDGEGDCKTCGGELRLPEMVPEFRLDLIRRVVCGWSGLLAKDPVSGAVVEVPYSEKARDGLARMVRDAFEPVRAAAQRLGLALDEKKDGSASTPIESSVMG